MFKNVSILQLLLLCSALMPGQTFRGGVSGTVVDQSGATVVNASVKLVGTDTGLTSHPFRPRALANSPSKICRLENTRSRSRNQAFRPNRSTTSTSKRAKFSTCKPSSPSLRRQPAVEVSAATVAIETSSSALTSIIPTKAILDVPLNGRDFTQLLKLNPGVNAAGSVNGTRTNAINWQIDGADNNDQWHNSAAVNQGGVSGIAGTILPIDDAIDEFSLQTNNNAEQGRNSGGTLNLIIKSGTNNFHGSLYYFNRNEFLAARNWFTPATSPVQELRNNQEGGSLGGPIWRNHTFFFLTYEQQNFVAGNTAQGTAPSQAWVSASEQVLARKGVQVNPVSLNLINNLWPANSLTGPATQNNLHSAPPTIFSD